MRLYILENISLIFFGLLTMFSANVSQRKFPVAWSYWELILKDNLVTFYPTRDYSAVFDAIVYWYSIKSISQYFI